MHSEIINLTDRSIALVVSAYAIDLPPSALPAIVDRRDDVVGYCEFRGGHIPIIEHTARRVLNLPKPDPYKIYIASPEVAAAARQYFDRSDVYATGRLVHDGQGKVLGVGALLRVR